VAAVTSRGCVRLRPFAPFSPQIAAKIGAIPGCHMRSGCLRVAFLMLWITGAASAQSPIEGTVRDSSGRPVPGASVVLQHEDGRTVATALADSDGKFRLPPVGAGAYTLKVQAAGYYVSAYDFVLRPRQVLSLNVDLQKLEAVQEKVEVHANRFGGVLDVTTRHGSDLAGHGAVNFRGATLDNFDLNADYGGQA